MKFKTENSEKNNTPYSDAVEFNEFIQFSGMLGLDEMLDAGESLGVPILAKRVFGFSPDNLWSPMCLPRHLLDRLSLIHI